MKPSKPVFSELIPRIPEQHECQKCSLHRKVDVPCMDTLWRGDGSILAVGVNPDVTDDQEGLPFSGVKGKKLEYCAELAGVDVEQLSLTNAVRCAIAGKTKPKKDQLVACGGHLQFEILTKKPKVILAMGDHAAQLLCHDWNYTVDLFGKDKKQKKKLKEWRGYPQQYTYEAVLFGVSYSHTCWVVPTYHPKYCLSSWEHDPILAFDLRTAFDYADGVERIKKPNTKIHVYRDLERIDSLFDYLADKKTYVLDLETTGLDFNKDEIINICFCAEEGVAHVIPLLSTCTPDVRLANFDDGEVLQLKQKLITLFKQTAIIGANIKFDIKFLRTFLDGFNDWDVAADTQIMHHIVQENHPHNLNFLTQFYLHWEKYDAEIDHFKKLDELNLAYAPEDLVSQYGGTDVDGTFRVFNILQKIIEQKKLTKVLRIETGLILPLADLEWVGVHASRSTLSDLAAKYKKEREKSINYLKRKHRQVFGGEKSETFNPNSNVQLIALLVACNAKLTKKTKSGQYTLDKLVIKDLLTKGGVPATIAKHIQLIRKYTKYISTYLEGADGDGGILQRISDRDRIHPNYNITGARTGRLAERVMVTIPRQGGLREMIIPDNPDTDVFLSVDYSKMELRVMAWLANEKLMLDELMSDIDLHTKMAVTARLMRNPTDEEYYKIAPEVSSNERAIAKGANFGIPYGRGAASIVAENPNSFPPKMKHWDRVKQVDRIIDAYYDKYQMIYKYMEKQKRIAHKRGWLRSSQTGRIRNLDGMKWFKSEYASNLSKFEQKLMQGDIEHIERESQNYQIQEIASSILSKQTKIVYDAIQTKQLGIRNFRIVLSIHDQLLFNCHRDDVQKAEAFARQHMEIVLPKTKKQKYEIPITVDAAVQRVWGENEYND